MSAYKIQRKQRVVEARLSAPDLIRLLFPNEDHDAIAAGQVWYDVTAKGSMLGNCRDELGRVREIVVTVTFQDGDEPIT